MNKELHVDDFVEGQFGNWKDIGAVMYATWFLFLKRMDALMMTEFKKFTSQYKLFCTYKGKRYRVLKFQLTPRQN